uniref:MSV199 domain-containing protein n=1 Tax=viral metagenome TaxID=1070528 RepID=A0A6C0JQR0_9ZZZZ
MSEMTNINIVELIENNPITKLSNTYQNKLLCKIKNNFTNVDQQLFVASFYSYLNYNSKTDFVIDLDDIWKWLEFSHKDKAKRLLEKCFLNSTDYKCLLTPKGEQKTGRGGHNKETFMLTINAFKRFCLKAETKKADQIHDYYIKLEETLHEVINEESNELKLQVNQLKNTLTEAKENLKTSDENNKKTIEKLKKDKESEKQNILLREFGIAGALVYILKVKSYETGEYIIKLGESRRGVQNRFNEHKTHYEEAVLLDCFMVKRSKDFESFLHNHSDIRFNQVKSLPNHEQENELFLIGKNLSYRTLLHIINTNINRFNEIDYNDIRIDIESIKSLLTNQNQQPLLEDKATINQLLENQKILIQKINQLEKSNKEILEKLNSSQTRTTTNFGLPLSTLGPRLQKINPETLQLIKVYETVTECMNENPHIKRPSINKAIEENTIYHGFRWTLVDREVDPNFIRDLQPTVETKIQSLGYVAKLNAEKTEILNVYLDRKTAAISNGYESTSALDEPVRKTRISKGHYYMLYEKCDNDLKTDFVCKNNGEPLLYKDGVGQYDENHNLIHEFSCKYDCIKKLHISDKTLTKALDKKVSYNGNYYKYIGSKMQCFS